MVVKVRPELCAIPQLYGIHDASDLFSDAVAALIVGMGWWKYHTTTKPFLLAWAGVLGRSC